MLEPFQWAVFTPFVFSYMNHSNGFYLFIFLEKTESNELKIVKNVKDEFSLRKKKKKPRKRYNPKVKQERIFIAPS